jgi:hypothetical protein
MSTSYQTNSGNIYIVASLNYRKSTRLINKDEKNLMRAHAHPNSSLPQHAHTHNVIIYIYIYMFDIIICL